MPFPEADALQARAARFSVRLLTFVRSFAFDRARDVVLKQLLRSGAGIGANYRASRRSRSRAEFIARLAVVVEEADETEHWLGILRDSALASGPDFDWLLNESVELRAIFVASLRTARANHRAAQHNR
ncbi:MAG TPA: four helix bundle protein [Vicinamibacterales bacterium]|jgi:four helix bundle protein|nr:four helix bundle protein [Vicinamibacterales bacterium]